jgi:hypothetical protein
VAPDRLRLAWEKREAIIHSYEKREGEELNVKKVCHLGMPHHHEMPMWLLWSCTI